MEQARRDAVARYRGLLVRLVDIAAGGGGDTPAVAEAVLDAMCRTLRLADGTIMLFDEDNARLVTAAVCGANASFVRDAPPVPVTSDYESARVFRDGSPRYVGQLYADGPNGSGEAEGTSSWRSGIGVQASAVLPLALGGRRLGTLSLRWSAPQEFDEPMCELLEALASLAALAIEHARCTSAADGQLSAGQHHAQDVSSLTARLEVSSDGVLIPRPPDADWSGHETIRITVTTWPTEGQEMTHDAFVPRSGHVGVLVMRASASERASADAAVLIETLRQTARALAERPGGPATVISSLNGTVTSIAPSGTVIDAWLGTIDLATGALAWCSAGDTETLLHLADDRVSHARRSGPPLGSSSNASFAEEMRLLMPGDQLAMSIGGQAELRLERPS